MYIFLSEKTREKWIAKLLMVLLFYGLYAPTSTGSNISQAFLYLNLFFLAAIVLGLILLGKKIDIKMACSFLLINATLWISTWVTPLSEYSWGAAFLYFSLSLVMLLSLKGVQLPRGTTKIFSGINIINVLASIMVITQNETVTTLLINHYNNFYPELVPNMMRLMKPVLTFGTQSIAGFYMYVFFYLNLKTFNATKNMVHLVFSFAYLYFCFALDSNTGYLFLLIGVVHMAYYWFTLSLPRIVIVGVVLGVLFIFNMQLVTNAYHNVIFSIEQKLGSEHNGIAGRYSESGNLQHNMSYIAEHPFSPLGVGYSEEFMYVDSGFIEMTLRGTIILTLAVYVSFFLFLKNNLRSKKTAYFLFIIFMLFEVGFSNLTYFRTIYLLPFVVVYLNHLDSIKEAKTINPQITVPKRQIA